MKLSGFCTSFFVGFSSTLTVPSSNDINLATNADTAINFNLPSTSLALALSNSTQPGILGAVDPKFKIQYPRVFDKPLDRVAVFMTAIAWLVELAQQDYFGTLTGITRFSSIDHPSVQICIVPRGPSTPYIFRYFVIWGVYFAVLYMSRFGSLKESIFKLTYNGNLIGQLLIRPVGSSVGASDAGLATLGNVTSVPSILEYAGAGADTALVNVTVPAEDLALATSSPIPDANLSDAFSSNATYQTYSPPPTNLSAPPLTTYPVSLVYTFQPRPMPDQQVFLTIIAALAQSNIPIHPAEEILPSDPQIFRSPFDTDIIYSRFTRPLPPPLGPQWQYEYLIRGLGLIPKVMAERGRFAEIEVIVRVNSGAGPVPVGNIALRKPAR